MIINAFTLRIFTGVLNRYLRLDPESGNHIIPLVNKVLCVDLHGVDKKLYFIFNDDNVLVKLRCENEPDAVICATPLALARFFANKQTRLLDDDIKMTGKVRFAQDVQKLFKSIDIDWEEKLATLTGDVPAHHIGRAARILKNASLDVKQTLEKNTTEYLQEEAKLTPPRVLVDDFCEEVDQLRMDIDRMGARINVIENKMGEVLS